MTPDSAQHEPAVAKLPGSDRPARLTPVILAVTTIVGYVLLIVLATVIQPVYAPWLTWLTGFAVGCQLLTLLALAMPLTSGSRARRATALIAFFAAPTPLIGFGAFLLGLAQGNHNPMQMGTIYAFQGALLSVATAVCVGAFAAARWTWWRIRSR